MADEEGFKVATAFVQVDPDASDFREKLQAALDEAVAGVEANVRVGLDDDDLRAKLDRDKAELDAMDGREVKAALGLDDDDFRVKADDDKADLDAIDGRKASAELGLADDDFRGKIDDDKADLDEMDGKHADATLGLDDDDFRAKLAEDEAALHSLSGSASLGASGGGGGEGGGSLIGAITLGASSLLPGIAPAVAGLGLLGGTAGLAFGGIGKALSAHSQATQNVGTTQAQLAATAFSNSVAIQQAQQAEQQAYQQAAEAASQSAAQVESAQMSEAEAVRNAAASQAQALQAVTQAQQQEQAASFGLGTAQYNLRDAWIQARYALEQLNDAEHNSATTIKAARLAVAQAVYQQQLTDQNAMTTSLDRQQAAIAVTQAQEQLTAAQQQASYTGQEANLQDKAGVAGSQQVLGAKQALRQAMEAVRNAAVAEKDAVRNLTDTELNNADQVKAAQLAVSQAVKQAAYQQQQSALAERNAAQNVANTYKEQQLQAAATASTSNQAANQFAKDMARLTPAGRAFVDELLGMRGALRGLEADAQNAILPGMTIFLQGVKSVLPEIRAGVSGMGRAMGDAFGAFGKVMQTPAFASGLQGLIRNGIRFADIVLPAFAQFIGELGKLGSKGSAVTGLANLLAGLAHGLTGIATGLAPYTKQISQFLTAAGNIIAAIGPPLGQIVGLIAVTLGPLSRYLDAHPNGTVVKVIGDIVAGMLALKGLQKILPDFITGPLGKLGGKVSGLITTPLKDAAGKIPGLLGKGWELAGQGALRVFGEGGLIGRAAGGMFDTLRLRGMYASEAISGGFSKVSGVLSGAFSSIRLRGMYAWEGIQGAASSAWTGISGFGSKVGSMMSSAGSSVATFAATMGTRLAAAATATGTWIAENTAAAGSFIAENVAMAASATAAFIAENAATLGIAAGVAALVTGIIYLATHWHQVWDGIKAVAEDAWHFITSGWGEYLFPEITAIRVSVEFLSQHWSEIWGGIKKAAEDAWDFLTHGWGQLLVPEITLIRLAIGFLGDHWSQIWGDIQTVTEGVWHDAIQPVLDGIATGVQFLVNDVIEPYFRIWMDQFTLIENAALFMWHNVIDPVFQGIRTGADAFVSGFKTAWSKLETIFKTPVNFLINTVYDNGIMRLWNDVVKAIGLTSLKLPPIPSLAGGGIVPGRDPGHDNQLVAMRSGEGVLQPGAVRAVGAGTIHALNAEYGDKPVSGATHGGTSGPGGMPGFAHGGLLGFIDRGISDIGHGLIDAAKFAAELATNPAGAITGILDKTIHTDATGNLGKVMTAIPRTMVGDMAKVFGADVLSLMSAGSGGGLGGNATGQSIVKYAESFIGKVPYLFGGTTTAGWDCSAFVDHVYEHFGFHPPRSSESQFGWAQRVPDPVLGGLAFFTGSPQDPPPGHVGIVTGSNQMVDAFGTGFGTRLNAIRGSSGTVMGFGVPPGGGLLSAGGPGGTATPGLITVAKYLMSHGASRAAAAGIAGTVAGESGGNPLSVGSGGGGLLGWTPVSSAYPYPILRDSDPNRQMAIQLVDMLAYINQNGSISDLNRSALGGPSAAAWHFSAAYEKPAVTGSDIRPDVVSQLYKEGYDSGGWLMPSGMPGAVPVNSTGQPEAVLTPAESQAWVALVKRMLAQGSGGMGANVQFVYNGPQVPTPEMQAMMRRDLALTLSSG